MHKCLLTILLSCLLHVWSQQFLQTTGTHSEAAAHCRNAFRGQSMQLAGQLLIQMAAAGHHRQPTRRAGIHICRCEQWAVLRCGSSDLTHTAGRPGGCDGAICPVPLTRTHITSHPLPTGTCLSSRPIRPIGEQRLHCMPGCQLLQLSLHLPTTGQL